MLCCTNTVCSNLTGKVTAKLLNMLFIKFISKLTGANWKEIYWALSAWARQGNKLNRW
jgi:hypothetical protein